MPFTSFPLLSVTRCCAVLPVARLSLVYRSIRSRAQFTWIKIITGSIWRKICGNSMILQSQLMGVSCKKTWIKSGKRPVPLWSAKSARVHHPLKPTFVEIRLAVWYSFHANKRDYFLFEGQRFLSNFRRVARWRDQRWSSALLGKWHAFPGWETHFQLVKPYFLVGQSPFYICWWKKNTFIKQFMNEGRLRRILGHCTFSVSTSFCSNHLSKVHDYHICFCFIPSPIVSNRFCHHCCLFWSCTHHHSNLVFLCFSMFFYVFLCFDFFNFLFACYFAWTPSYWKRCRCDMSSPSQTELFLPCASLAQCCLQGF